MKLSVLQSGPMPADSADLAFQALETECGQVELQKTPCLWGWLSGLSVV